MFEQPQKENIVEKIDQIDIKRAALAWENFTKRLETGMRESEAQKLLFEELSEALNKKGTVSESILLEKPGVSLEKLKNYLSKGITPDQLKFVESELEPALRKAKPDELTELQAANNAFVEMDEYLVKEFDKILPTPSREQLELYQEYIRIISEASEFQEKNSNIKERIMGYKKANQAFQALKTKLEATHRPK